MLLVESHGIEPCSPDCKTRPPPTNNPKFTFDANRSNATNFGQALTPQPAPTHKSRIRIHHAHDRAISAGRPRLTLAAEKAVGLPVLARLHRREATPLGCQPLLAFTLRPRACHRPFAIIATDNLTAGSGVTYGSKLVAGVGFEPTTCGL